MKKQLKGKSDKKGNLDKAFMLPSNSLKGKMEEPKKKGSFFKKK